MTSKAQQFNGREGETATFLSRCPLNLNGLLFGFAPRHLNRWAFLGKIKRFIMTGKIKTFLAITFTLFLLSVSTLACTCVRTKIKAKGFRGQLFAVLESRPNDKEPFPQATIKLLKRTDDGDKLIVEVVADGEGRFSLENVKAGKYILVADAPNFQAVWTEIKIVRSSSRKKDEIEIGLDPSVTDCCVGYAKVQKAKKS